MARIIKLKRRLNQFFISDDQDLVFAMYVDIDDNVHYRYCNYDTDKHEMLEQQFFKEFTLFREEEEHVKQTGFLHILR